MRRWFIRHGALFNIPRQPLTKRSTQAVGVYISSGPPKAFKSFLLLRLLLHFRDIAENVAFGSSSSPRLLPFGTIRRQYPANHKHGRAGRTCRGPVGARCNNADDTDRCAPPAAAVLREVCPIWRESHKAGAAQEGLDARLAETRMVCEAERRRLLRVGSSTFLRATGLNAGFAVLRTESLARYPGQRSAKLGFGRSDGYLSPMRQRIGDMHGK